MPDRSSSVSHTLSPGSARLLLDDPLLARYCTSLADRLRSHATRLARQRRALRPPGTRRPASIERLTERALRLLPGTAPRLERLRHPSLPALEVDGAHTAHGLAALFAAATFSDAHSTVEVRQSERFVEVAVILGPAAGTRSGSGWLTATAAPVVIDLAIAWACGRAYDGGLMLEGGPGGRPASAAILFACAA
jgi:hypothetical protein